MLSAHVPNVSHRRSQCPLVSKTTVCASTSSTDVANIHRFISAVVDDIVGHDTTLGFTSRAHKAAEKDAEV